VQIEYQKINSEHVEWFKDLLGAENTAVDMESRKHYGHDETEDFVYPPEVVVRPGSAEDVSAIMKYCFSNYLPVTPLGGRTGLSGGALCLHGGVGLSLEKLNRIISIDQKNLQVTVEPGVITQILQEEVEKHNLYYAPDPSSRGSCFIGGNLAENAGGPRAVKYGVTKDFVLNLEVVLPNGDKIWTGANTLKNSTGYNLTQLMVGSEGTLGVITKAVLKLIPRPKHNLLMLVPFSSAEKACESVSAIFRAGIVPSALEFMERDAIDWTMNYVDVNVAVPDDVDAHLLIEVDGSDMDLLFNECEVLTETLEEFGCGEIMFAESQAQKDTLWKLRRSVAEAVKANSTYKEEDTVVPRYELPRLLKKVKEIGEEFGFQSVCYGHAGDGNLHINIIKGDLSDEKWENELPIAIKELFEYTVSIGGTLSGEHGIGYVQKDYMSIAFNDIQMELMKGIKTLFDPKGIMNPGKIFPK